MIHFPQIQKTVLLILCTLISLGSTAVLAGGFSYGDDKTVVGFVQHHTVAPKETLLDIARSFGLGYNEIRLLYSKMDPWLPDIERNLAIPTQWVLPATKFHGLVINLPELRLYHFLPKIGMVTTYPVGIGDIDWETPVTTARVVHRQIDPTWVVPETLRDKYKRVSIPPGPNNPLGKYWIGLSLNGYGIHGTNSPWGIGRLVSHGCIRLYPEHIVLLFEEVYVNTRVEIVYEPVKIGIRDHKIFVEVHPDIYNRISDIKSYTLHRLKERGLLDRVSIEVVGEVLKKQTGVPIQVGFFRKGGDDSIAAKASDS